mgnify:CR=1 FL=1
MYRCIGCNARIPWDGTGLFSFTCQCGATIFLNDETGQTAMPSSVIIGVSKGKNLPHLNDLVGNSDFTSVGKQKLISQLRGSGLIWMRECEQCREDGTLEHYESRLRWEQLRRQICEQAHVEGWSIEKTIQELVKADKDEENRRKEVNYD